MSNYQFFGKIGMEFFRFTILKVEDDEMGLIKVAKDALSSLLADQWRECFECNALSSDVLVKKG